MTSKRCFAWLNATLIKQDWQTTFQNIKTKTKKSFTIWAFLLAYYLIDILKFWEDVWKSCICALQSHLKWEMTGIGSHGYLHISRSTSPSSSRWRGLVRHAWPATAELTWPGWSPLPSGHSCKHLWVHTCPAHSKKDLKANSVPFQYTTV